TENRRRSGSMPAALLAAAMFFAAAAVAQEGTKESPPPGGPPKDFALPEKQVRQLDNGLEITAVQFGSVPKATVSVVISAGNLNEGDRTWLADLTGDFLLEGTTTLGAEDIAREAAAMGGQVGVTVTEDLTTISGDVLTEFVPQMARLLADIARNPQFPPGELERLRRDRLRIVSIARTEPDQMALAAFREAIYGEHPYGKLLPDEEQLRSYDIDAVRAFHESNFGARRTHVFVAGMFDADETIAAIEE